MEKRRLAIIALLVVVIICGAVWNNYWQNRSHSLSASGNIEAVEVVVSSKVVGRVTNINVDEGSTVTVGQIIAQIEKPDYYAALQSAKSRQTLAKSDYYRNKKLFDQGLVSDQQMQTAISNVDSATSGLQNAQSQFDNTDIKAPIDGVVLVKAIEAGELATVGTPIVTMANLKELNLRVYVDEVSYGKISLGEGVLVSVDSFPKEKFKGTVTYISNQAEFTPKSIQTKDERVAQVFAIKIKIANPELKLKPGMPADAQFLQSGDGL